MPPQQEEGLRPSAATSKSATWTSAIPSSCNLRTYLLYRSTDRTDHLPICLLPCRCNEGSPREALLFLFLLFAEERPLPCAVSPGPAVQQQQQLGSTPKQSLSTEPEQAAGSPSSSPSMRGLSSYFSKTFSTVFSQGSSHRPLSTLVDELWLSEEGMLRMVVVVFLLLLRPFLLSSADDGNGQRISLPEGPLQHTQRILSALLALVHRPHSLAAATSGLSFTDFVPCFKRATTTSSSPSGMQQQRSSLAQDIVACDLSVADVQAALRELSTDVMVSEAKVGRCFPLLPVYERRINLLQTDIEIKSHPSSMINPTL